VTPPDVAVVAVVGPTAAGKSHLAIALARALGGEVVNADSMQVYRGMDIGTAKLRPEEWAGVPHHLLDIWDVRRAATVAEFRDLARHVISEIRDRGATPVLAGGSGLYVRGILDELDFPGTDPEIRARLESELSRDGAEALHARLETLDPRAATKILATNGRRIVRALEVIELTGRPFTATLPVHTYALPAVQIGISIPREVLHARIAERVDRMWEQGLVAEVAGLDENGLREGLTASRALGYRQVLAFLDGECSEDEARAETVRATRKFARRQETWFRRDPRVHWLAYDDPDLLGAALRLIGAATHP
jgi:tRNA dimethylallyltransferase